MATDTEGVPPSTPEGEGAMPTPKPESKPESAWDVRVGAFASAVGKPASDISTALAALAGEPGDAALEVVSDQASLTDDDLKSALVDGGPKIPLGQFRKHLPVLRGPQKAPVIEMPAASTGSVMLDVLPPLPSDDSFLEALKVGGVLKPAATEVLAAIKTALAGRSGLYGLPKVLADKMEAHADSLEEPVGESFWAMRKMLTQRDYADVLRALGVEGQFMTEARKKDFLERVDAHLWAEIRGFHEQLLAWQETWATGMANPAMALGMLAMAQSGGGGAMMPPGLLSPPNTDPVRDRAEAVINSVNRVFAGVGVAVARALAYEATRIKGVLENPELPAAIGAANREQMLKLLGVSVSADYVRLERDVARYTFAIMELPKVTSGQSEYTYLAALFQLGNSIPWDKLDGGSTGGRSGIGRRGQL